MNSMQKQRLIGAVVLLALGVIIVPVLFDFSREQQSGVKGVEMPPAPEVMHMEVLPLDDWSQKAEPAADRVEEPAAVAEVVEPAEPPVSVPVQAEVVVPPPPPPQSEPAVVAPPPEPKVVKPAPAAPVTRPAAIVNEGWVLQIASLTVEAKANELRDQLRKAGYPVFIEYGKSGGAAIYRVKAGPVVSRSAIDELKALVKQKTGLDGLVVQYP